METDNGMIVESAPGVISVSGANIRNCLHAVRKATGRKLNDSREVLRSGGEDGLYRVELADGLIVEVTIIPHGCSIIAPLTA